MAHLDALEKRKISSPAGTRTITTQSFLPRNAVVLLTDLSGNKFVKYKIKIRRRNTWGFTEHLCLLQLRLWQCVSWRPSADSGRGVMTVIKRARAFR